MDLRQFEMLLAVVECGGFKKAGEHLHVSHSAIHRQIRILEQELQCSLLVRMRKHMKLTKAGGLLVQTVRRVRQEIAQVRAQITGSNQLQSGQLRIGTGTSILSFFLPPILERFRSEFPGVEVSVMAGTAGQVGNEILSGDLDIGVAYAPEDVLPGEISLRREVLYTDHFVLAVGEGHPLARRKSVSFQEAAQYPFILYPRPSHLRRAFDHLFQTVGVVPRIAMELENEEAIEKMIAANMGIAFLSKQRAASDRIRHVRLRGQALCCPVGLVLPKSDYLSPSAREFARMCREAAKRRARSKA